MSESLHFGLADANFHRLYPLPMKAMWLVLPVLRDMQEPNHRSLVTNLHHVEFTCRIALYYFFVVHATVS